MTAESPPRRGRDLRWTITRHAAKRYMERARTGAKTEDDARALLAAEVQFAEYVGTREDGAAGGGHSEVWFLPASGTYAVGSMSAEYMVARTVIEHHAPHAQRRMELYSELVGAVRAALSSGSPQALYDRLAAVPALVSGVERPLASEPAPAEAPPLRLVIEHRVTFVNDPPRLRKKRQAAGGGQ